MAFDYQKLGLDRIAQNISRSVNQPSGNLITGDITRGETVVVRFDAEDSASTSVKARRSGALPASVSLDGFAEIQWNVSDTILTVTLNISRTGTLAFWVY